MWYYYIGFVRLVKYERADTRWEMSRIYYEVINQEYVNQDCKFFSFRSTRWKSATKITLDKKEFWTSMNSFINVNILAVERSLWCGEIKFFELQQFNAHNIWDSISMIMIWMAACLLHVTFFNRWLVVFRYSI